MKTKEVYERLAAVRREIDFRLMVEDQWGSRVINADEVILEDRQDPNELQKRNALQSLLTKLEDVARELDYLERPIQDVGVLCRNESGRYELNGMEFTSGREVEILMVDPEGEEPAYWVHTRVEHDGTDYYAVYGHKKLAGLQARIR